MRILVADQNTLLLAAITATFGRHCEIVAATRRDACLEQLEQRKFDVVVACEKLADYTGLELLSEIEALAPLTLRIFSARPESLKRLGSQLDHFGLLGTLSYPIDARKLLIALKVARSRLPARPKPPKAPPAVRHVVLETEWDTGERLALLESELEKAPESAALPEVAPPPDRLPAAPEPPTTRHLVRHVVLETEWITGERPALPGKGLEKAPASAAPPPEGSFDEHPDRTKAAVVGGPVVAAPGRAPAPIAQDALEDDYAAANDEAFSGTPGRTATTSAPTRTRSPQDAQLATAASPTRTPTYQDPPQARVSPAQARTAQDPPQAIVSPPARARTAQDPPQAMAASPTRTQMSQDAPEMAATRSDSPVQGDGKGPRPRTPTMPTEAQREAFQRARARRNSTSWAAEMAGLRADPGRAGAFGPIQAPSRQAPPSRPLPSLMDLARLATTKRPLPGSRGGAQQKRKAFVAGSGILAMLLVGVVSFELLRVSPPVDHGRHRLPTITPQAFTPISTLMADRNGGPPPVFSAPAPKPSPTPSPAASMVGLHAFDPNTVVPDPPPPAPAE